ncbi:B-cell lymphoma 3 protein-like protein [Microtus ochrogaster]|uniref:B-cell lymphoma 3 protein-like protein n=1 Tax=Microtus ochrogaster TaxID=79684 RepID=A0A8J6G783_MICOH|nr:B-cell lymphoma 3 protein-like protein [Microtus ochrogaster]
MPRCPAGAMDEGPVDLRTRPKGAPGAALPLRKRPLRPTSPEPTAPRTLAGTQDPLRSSCDTLAVLGPPHGVARPEALYYQGPLVPIYPTPTVGPPFPLLNLPTHLYPRMCPVEHPLSADIALATRADEDGDTYILWAGNVVLLSTADAVMERLGQDVTAKWTMSPEQHGGKCGRGEERACEPAMVSQQRQGPLHIAVVQNNKAIALRLVILFQQGGRELDVHNNLRQTPLHLAVITALPDMVRLLVTAGASPMALDRHGQTAVHLACEHRSPSCLQALLDNATPGSVDLEARNYEGLTALHVAVNTGCQEAVLLLLERGADIDAVDIKSGRSPLIHAVENNSLSMVQLLLLHGANVNAQMYSGSSALHSASGRGLLPLVRTLVRSGADSGLKNCHNDTPLMVARSRRVIDILRGKASRAASGSQPDPSPDQSIIASPESNSRLSSNGLLSSPCSSPPLSPSKDPPGFPLTPQNFFLPTASPPTFLPFPGVLRSHGQPVPPSPAPGSS